MPLPEFPNITPEQMQALLDRHHLSGETVTALPQVGFFNRVFQIGTDWILRVPRVATPFVDALTKERVAVPALVEAGVQTPELLAFDAALDLLPVPYGIYRRVEGQNLESLGLPVQQTQEIWQKVALELVKVHHLPDPSRVHHLQLEDPGTPESWIADFAQEGHFTLEEARWLEGWVSRLKPYVLDPAHHTFRHGDMQGTNVMVHQGDFVALIDWGGCGWGDPVHDLVGVPLAASQVMLDTYRNVQPFPDDETAEARILLLNLQHLCFLVRRPATPEVSWAERPLSRWLDMVRHLPQLAEGRWKKFL